MKTALEISHDYQVHKYIVNSARQRLISQAMFCFDLVFQVHIKTHS